MEEGDRPEAEKFLPSLAKQAMQQEEIGESLEHVQS